MNYLLKQRLGAIIYDLPRFLWSMRPSSGHPWVWMRNRNERLIRAAHGQGAGCDWQWTSDLHLAKVFPSLGGLLMNRALRDWPIEFQAEPLGGDKNIRISFVIGHRGMERLPHLLLTLQSIAAQRDAALECLVVEQSASPEAQAHLPSWVRYIHTQIPHENMPYNRAWAFNVGASNARGEMLVLHDNDMLAPRDYGREIIARLREGYEVMNLKRFIFYLTGAESERLFSGAGIAKQFNPLATMQNSLGASIAVTAQAYWGIGGFDEAFSGWGGEDNEFWERAETRKVWPYGHLPFLHLWHPDQLGKFNDRRSTAALLETRSAIAPAARIAELRSRAFGKLPGDRTG